MILTIYIFIISYFVLGGIGFYFINRRKKKEVARESWTKFIAYFFIIHILFFGIVINPEVFRMISYAIVAVGAFELFRLFQKSKFENPAFFLLSMLLYAMFGLGFLVFANLKMELISVF